MNPRTLRTHPSPALALPLILATILATLSTPILTAFDSASDGSDGALDLSGTPPGQVVFDPQSFDPPLDADGDNVFHFTTITIPAGVELVFEARKLRYSPVYWLASGEVRIDGTLNLNGAPGHPGEDRRYSEPGPGGFHGGLGRRGDALFTAGFGPGGGVARFGSRGGSTGGSHATPGVGPSPPAAYGNRFLLPLVGGSGGGGLDSSGAGPGGGAGGGAVLIASSDSISLDGAITARGGDGGTGGAGGAVRLLTPSFGGTGLVDARGGAGGLTRGGGSGWIRVETRDRTFTGNLRGVANVVTLAPNPIFLPPPAPRMRVTRIAGVGVSPAPTGEFAVPDSTIDAAGPVTVEIEATQIPLGTVVTLLVVTEDSTDQSVESTGLAGTLESSTASAEVTFSSGFSRIFLRATW